MAKTQKEKLCMIFPFGNRGIFPTFYLKLCYNAFLLTRCISFNLNTHLICIHFYSRKKFCYLVSFLSAFFQDIFTAEQSIGFTL